jgi:hypothetical protein
MMEELFVKAYVLISLWFWAGMLLSEPLRKAFGEMHRRLGRRIYDATWGQVVKLKNRATRLVDRQREKLKIRVARSFISQELLDELTHKNLVAAISRAKKLSMSFGGTDLANIQKVFQLCAGKHLEEEVKKVAVVTSFDICDTHLFTEIMTKVPRAQERILLALDELQGNPPYDSILNQEYRKFIRE